MSPLLIVGAVLGVVAGALVGNFVKWGIASVNAVFDWKAWQEKELGITFEEAGTEEKETAAAEDAEAKES